ncbi:porin [Sulfurisoma sediminicola]|uniref:Porin n=1 Tax=Sulfurisoma sediminicola TaxID=1381557 RepID=A0A497XKB0_9PROT|nr:porin [Sulfurisoma sediminicola]
MLLGAVAATAAENGAAPDTPAPPAEEAAPDYAATTLSGDWGGLRAHLYKAGLTTEFIWKLDALSNSRGGIQSGDEVMGNLDSKFKLDLDRLLGWNEATAYLHVIAQQGGKFNARHVGSTLGVSNIETPTNTTKILHGWLQKNFDAGRASLLAGLYPIDSEFSVLDSAAVFVQPPYGASGELALTRGPSIFNTSSFGLRGKLVSDDQTLYAQAAVLDGVPGDPVNPKGTHVQFNKGDGSFTIAEIGWMPAEFGHAFEPTQPAAVPQTPAMVVHERYDTIAKYAVGAWRYTAKADDLFAVDAAGTPLRQPSWGAYLLAERTLFRLDGNPLRRLAVFGRYSMTDGRSSALRDAFNVGVSVRGIAASREDDHLGIAFTRGRYGGAWREAQAAAGNETVNSEDAVEVHYRAQISRKFYLQPLWQRIEHPGGDRTVKNADILGLRFELVI